MLKRKAYDRLLQWKNSSEKKALCVTGARQIGKTTIIREFAKNQYDFFIEINFITDTDAVKIFDGNLDADTIITNMTAFTQKPMEPGRTLVLLDEIQICPNARTAIKFLVEDGRFDYIESGSLLGVSYKEVSSFPVGFEEIYQMYPLDFEEYLWANHVQESTISYLKKCFDTVTPVSESVHSTMKKLFYSYIVVGGMPEAVQIYIDTHDIAKVISFQKNIIALYSMDITRYSAPDSKPKIKAIFESIPSQLNEKNRRFYVNSLGGNARLARYENSFKWLADAGVALPCYNIECPQPSLKLNEKHSLFKLFMNDTGLLCAASMDNIQFAILTGDLSINLGSILENVIAKEIKAHDFELYYFDSKKYGEVDFVIQNGTAIDVIEVKSGNDYKIHSALDRVLRVDEWKFKNIFVFCKDNMQREDDIIYCPWYMIMFYHRDELLAPLKYEVDLSALQGCGE